jgi:hypothetical protein
VAEIQVRADDDVKKAGRGVIDSVSDQVRKSTNATADFIGGAAEAVGHGFRSYNDAITSDNLTTIGVNNGLIEGMIAGYAGFYEKMAAAANSMLASVRREPRAAGAASIDTKALAQDIANALKSDPSFVEAVAAKVHKKG